MIIEFLFINIMDLLIEVFKLKIKPGDEYEIKILNYQGLLGNGRSLFCFGYDPIRKNVGFDGWWMDLFFINIKKWGE